MDAKTDQEGTKIHTHSPEHRYSFIKHKLKGEKVLFIEL
jgi:hypothetical protein